MRVLAHQPYLPICQRTQPDG